MKILMITSGFKGIYDYFDAWIMKELKKKHEVKLFQFKEGLTKLQLETKEFKPDMALTLVGFKLPLQMVDWLKKHQVKTAVWFTEDPYFMDRTKVLSQYYDFVFTIDSAAQDYYKNNGHLQAHQLSLAAEPEVYKPKQVGAKFRSDICLVGFPYPDRIHLIQYLLQNTSYHIKVVGKWASPLFRFRSNPRLMIHEGWVDPSVVADYYNGAKIVLNTHRPFNLKGNQNKLGIVGKSINNRTFDVAACGTFQLIQFREDLPNHFINDEEIVSFKKNQELCQKLDYYLKTEDERQRIANNARKRVLQDHTFEQRLEKLLEIVKN
ncbi:glycosyltransferase [Neobacillus sp. 179-C4.2 HS]|uniref:Glycosyltransferase n=1 Tax=Neobacillus driksii TaxID=3035913 RepID=A0ABV4YSC6_9BACI|nr:glycosyltransferase [Neobacillus sp. 179.-C4.2 HS]MDP5194117.1 glycosyltransferase [Neobacillus sp. 179.-C4.2 HS]